MRMTRYHGTIWLLERLPRPLESAHRRNGDLRISAFLSVFTERSSLGICFDTGRPYLGARSDLLPQLAEDYFKPVLIRPEVTRDPSALILLPNFDMNDVHSQ